MGEGEGSPFMLDLEKFRTLNAKSGWRVG